MPVTHSLSVAEWSAERRVCRLCNRRRESLRFVDKALLRKSLRIDRSGRERERDMASSATMAVSAPTSSLRVLPSFDGLRAQQQASYVKATPAPSEKTGRLLIVADKKVQKRRQIVLTEDIPSLGKTGELCSVKTGYFRNYLYPTGKAKIATAELLKSIKLEAERVAAEKRRVKEEAESIARQFQAVGFFNVRRRGGQGKQIFGSVTSQDVVDIIRAQTGRDVDKRVVTVPEIREIGQYTVEIKLHPEVIAPVKINVIAK